MPYISNSFYSAPFWLPGRHIQTIYPTFFRKVSSVPFIRSRLNTPDGDFILLDTLRSEGARSETVVILSHGLEGDSRRKYIQGMASIFAQMGWDSVARNFRGCGGEINRTSGLYHSGQTEDLHSVVQHCLTSGYRRIFLVGFSMGGNQTLKYLGEDPIAIPKEVIAAVAFSTPCNLPGAAKVLDRPGNAIYMRHFLHTLRQKVRQKHETYPNLYPLNGLDAIQTFAEFDAVYTAPVHGFSSAENYWEKAACLPYVSSIAVPVLLVNALNDPFLSPACYPVQFAEQSPLFFLETPKNGGHVGFTSRVGQTAYWSESRTTSFFTKVLQTKAQGTGIC